MNIPAHLRGEGMVGNLHMSKKEVNQLISNFWKYHLAHDASDMMVGDLNNVCSTYTNIQCHMYEHTYVCT